jgi:hypothetical protein
MVVRRRRTTFEAPPYFLEDVLKANRRQHDTRAWPER